MKKISLKDSTRMLSRNEMKNISGGTISGGFGGGIGIIGIGGGGTTCPACRVNSDCGSGVCSNPPYCPIGTTQKYCL